MSHSHTHRGTSRSIVFVFVMLLAGSTVAAGQPTPFVCGDADGDGSLSVTDGVQVLARAADLGGRCTSGLAACDVDGDGAVTVTDGVAVLRKAAGLSAASACASPVVGDERAARSSVEIAGCESVTAESRYCLTFALSEGLDRATLAVLGLDSGRVCDVAEIPAEIGSDVRAGSIGWRGEILYACTADGVVRLSLLDGMTERLSVPCEAVAASGAGIYVMRAFSDASFAHPPGEVLLYASEEDLRTDHVAATYQLRGSSRLTATDDALYGAWHSTDAIDVVDATTGTHLTPIDLEGDGDWVNGVSVLEDGSLVVDKFVGGPAVTVYDAASGARTGAVTPLQPLNGLACVSRP